MLHPKHNPFRKGSIAYNHYDFVVTAHGHKPTEQLEALRDERRAMAHDFCRFSWKQMADFDFEADVLQDIINRR